MISSLAWSLLTVYFQFTHPQRTRSRRRRQIASLPEMRPGTRSLFLMYVRGSPLDSHTNNFFYFSSLPLHALTRLFSWQASSSWFKPLLSKIEALCSLGHDIPLQSTSQFWYNQVSTADPGNGSKCVPFRPPGKRHFCTRFSGPWWN